MEYKSRTQRKKEADSLQETGEKLVKLTIAQLKDFDLPSEIYDAVICAKTIKANVARRRQMQYIGTLMRKCDPVPIEQALQEIEEGSHQKAVAFKETERWRDALIEQNREVMEEILVSCPDADRQQLARLVRNAIKERDTDKPPKASRALFRYLMEIRPQ